MRHPFSFSPRLSEIGRPHIPGANPLSVGRPKPIGTDPFSGMSTPGLNPYGGSEVGYPEGIFENFGFPMDATLMTLGSVLGSSATASADPNIAQGVLGGAMQGVGAGSQLGPLGAIAGGFLGAATGFYRTGQQKQEYEELRNMRERQEILGRTVEPFSGFMAKKGGYVAHMKPEVMNKLNKVMKMQVGGSTAFIPLQAEKGEIAVLPDLTMSKVKADKLHEDMEDDEVTDLLPEGSFIFSDRDSEMIDKDSMDDIIGYSPLLYKENGGSGKIEEFLFSDVMSKDEMTPAGIAKNIQNRFKVKGKEYKDIFSHITDAENRESRIPYLKILINRQGDNAGAQLFKKGGWVKKYQDEGFVFDPTNVNNRFSNMFGQFDDLETEAYQNAEASQQAYDRLFRRLGTYDALGGLSDFLTTGFQSTRVDPVRLSASFAPQMFQDVPQSVIDTQMNRLNRRQTSLANTLLDAGVNPSQVPSIMAGSQQRTLDAQNEAMSGYNIDRTRNRQKYFDYISQIENKNLASAVQAHNAARANRNRKIAQLGETANRFLNNRQRRDIDQTGVDQSIMRELFNNRFSLLQNRLNFGANRDKFNMLRNYYDSRISALENAPSELYGDVGDPRETLPGAGGAGSSMMSMFPTSDTSPSFFSSRPYNLANVLGQIEHLQQREGVNFDIDPLPVNPYFGNDAMIMPGPLFGNQGERQRRGGAFEGLNFGF